MQAYPYKAAGVCADEADARAARTSNEGCPRVAPRRMRLRVLLVEDDPGTRRALRDYLRLCGHLVESAACARDALVLGRRFRPEVLVSDWCLGAGPDGLDTASALIDEYGEVSVLFLTACDPDRLRRASGGLPVAAVLRKPVRPSLLRAEIERAARRARCS